MPDSDGNMMRSVSELKASGVGTLQDAKHSGRATHRHKENNDKRKKSSTMRQTLLKFRPEKADFQRMPKQHTKRKKAHLNVTSGMTIRKYLKVKIYLL